MFVPKEESNALISGNIPPDREPSKHFSAYAEMHKADWIPANYDQNIYAPAAYDTFVWRLYKPQLIDIVRKLTTRRKHKKHTKYLDFACGTGRIISTLERFPTESVGLDISPQMVEYAKGKVSHSDVRCGNILSEPEIVDFDYDAITAFRFFLNTEPEMRSLIMHALAGRLADEQSRLIFNIHMNGWGVDGIKSRYSALRGWGRRNTLTFPEVYRLVKDAGLEIEAWYGFCLFPDRLYRGQYGNFFKRLDRWALFLPQLAWISKDMLFVCRPRVDAEAAQVDPLI